MVTNTQTTQYSFDTPTVITESALRTRINIALARVRAMSVEELRGQISQNGGSCEIDSKEAEVVISILEHDFGRDLAKVEDLEPEQMNTLNNLTHLIGTRLDVDH